MRWLAAGYGDADAIFYFRRHAADAVAMLSLISMSRCRR